MKPIDFIIIAVIVLIIGAALLYVISAKKKGNKCIGCPHAKDCGKEPCTCSVKPDKKNNE